MYEIALVEARNRHMNDKTLKQMEASRVRKPRNPTRNPEPEPEPEPKPEPEREPAADNWPHTAFARRAARRLRSSRQR